MFCTDWILPLDGDQLKAKCKYCSSVLNARYLQLLRHSLSNKHLCNAAAAATVSFPMDVDSCMTSEQSTTEGSQRQLIAGVDYEDDGHVLADEATDVQHLFADPTTVSFTADSVTDNKTGGLKKVGSWL